MQTLVINGSPVNNGATAEIVRIIIERFAEKHIFQSICLGDIDIKFCRGCKTCYTTAKCSIKDDVESLINQMDVADNIIFVVPSYWADIPGQLKTFFDRCTPYCNTHEPHASLKRGKRGYAIALRTGTNATECQHIIDSIEHYYGHMEIRMIGSFYLCGIKTSDDVLAQKNEIHSYCDQWFVSI